MTRSNESKKGSVKVKIALFILLLLIVGVASGCLFAPVFDITDVITKDGVNVTSNEIFNAANIQKGTNIFRINDSKIIKQIKSLPYVRTAKIGRSLPSTVILKYEEREPYAIVKYLESFAIVDKYSYVLEMKKENPSGDLPIIYGLDSGECVVGKKLEGTTNLKYENCIYLLETANNMNFEYKFTEINYEDALNVKLYIKEKDVDVIYGEVNIDNIEEKLSHLSSILKELGDKKGKIDISNEDYLAKSVFTERK